jgi:hypothetical protein
VGVAQCLGRARHGGVAGAIFMPGSPSREIRRTLPMGETCNDIRESRISSARGDGGVGGNGDRTAADLPSVNLIRMFNGEA